MLAYLLAMFDAPRLVALAKLDGALTERARVVTVLRAEAAHYDATKLADDAYAARALRRVAAAIEET
jgi:hypothetical protein